MHTLNIRQYSSLLEIKPALVVSNHFLMLFFTTASPVISQPSVLERDRLQRLSLVFHPVIEHIDFSILTLYITKILQDFGCL